MSLTAETLHSSSPLLPVPSPIDGSNGLCSADTIVSFACAIRGTLQERLGCLRQNQRLAILIANSFDHEAELSTPVLGFFLLHSVPTVTCEPIREEVEICPILNFPAESLP